ncbi:PAS domain-containing protein [Rubrivivax sp. A210]|uniref:methyl-accepting chemotaxis protein n=1 Tax=Rubrivivax sp. A210 TaxID=2772301 RepID=UPI00191B6954|nr:PAS domain-containing methyl-accepting chemotaxis protein [Rubrivivax sp. A210]CAD5374164.1 PAS domain-containing protein [Rubrivivax sp. A210]
MRNNLPVTQREIDYPANVLLVSQTDERGHITHCNQGFVNISGYSYEELLGQPHNLVRHPDMPEEAFKDLWQTIGRGRPWSGVVKNRCKSGDHYWVLANVSPVMEGGKPSGYISVRTKPTRQQVQEAEALYERILAERTRRPSLRLHAGRVRRMGIVDWPARVHRLSMRQRMALALAFLALGQLMPGLLGLSGTTALAAQVATSVIFSTVVFIGFVRQVARPLDEATDLATQVAGCNLDGNLEFDHRGPVGALMRNLWLVNLNMRAIVADVRAEVNGVTSATSEIASGGTDLSARTEAQAASLEQTAASIEQITASVSQTATRARGLAKMGAQASTLAEQGGAAVEELLSTMERISSSSQRMGDIISLIESVAFQTNILALNAAVEAARAGEQGRGFAVVASEVRNLAQRSSAAAKDIRSLIGLARSEVEQGVGRTDLAKDAIGQVLRSVRDVSQQLAEVTRNTDEQSHGIAQVSEAVQHIDDVTQQNAALAEQSAAACQALEQRAGTLVRAVQIFRSSAAA